MEKLDILYEYDGENVLEKALTNLNLNIVKLIAEVAIWAHPDVVQELLAEGDNTNALWTKKCKRRRKANEIRRTLDAEGNFLDDNTIANKAIKVAVGGSVKPGSFAVCHVYEGKADKADYYTSIPNLVLIPNGLQTLTDSHKEIQRVLQYHSQQLYGVIIDEEIQKPEGYDNLKFNEPMPMTNKIRKSIKHRRKTY